GFRGRPRDERHQLPPGQYETTDFPVLSADPTPRIDKDAWEFTVRTKTGARHTWNYLGITRQSSDPCRKTAVPGIASAPDRSVAVEG
ncbi:MAG: hypothetical protein HOY79_45850, partial [Streptomyces sp.]|nr:hypothetical protein [Streptomyces sp.]